MKNRYCNRIFFIAFLVSIFTNLSFADKSQDLLMKPVLREEAAPLSHEYAQLRKSQIINVDYQLSIKFKKNSDTFSGIVAIEFTMDENNVSPLTIDFDDGDVHTVKVNGKPVEFKYNQWYITLAASDFRPGNNKIDISYSRLYATNGEGLHHFTDPENGEEYLYTNFEPYSANRFFPHFDQPNLKARYILDVEAPADWQIISAMRENKIDKQGENRKWYFPQTQKLPSYIFPLHAGPFKIWEDKAGDIPLRLFARQSIAKYVKTNDWFTPTKQSFKFFNEYYQLKYPFLKYDQVIVPDFNHGAMENLAAVTFNEGYISRGTKPMSERRRLASIIAHEMAHMWFGNLVTMDWWNGLWLNESFASFMASLELHEASDFENIWNIFYSHNKQRAYRADQLVTTHPIELVVPTTADAFTNFDAITYSKGASVLKQLTHYLGEEEFRSGVGNYLTKFSYSNTSLDDFIGELGKAANKDLSNWKQEWLYKAGLNTIETSFKCEKGKLSLMEILQSAPKDYPFLREQRVQIGLYQITNSDMQLIDRVPVTYKGENTIVKEVNGKKCPDLVYPNLDDWGYVKVSLDKKSQQTLQKHINEFKEPGMRLMLWQSMWDSVVDANLRLDNYTDFALSNAADEQDDNVVRMVAGHLKSAYDYFTTLDGKPSFKQKYRQAIEKFVWLKLQSSKANSDQQQMWYRYFTRIAHTNVGLNKLVQLLENKLILDGLTIDQDKRWDLVIRLNQMQFNNYQEIYDAEIERDQSDRGKKSAIAAEVGRPLPELKEKWLKTIIEQPEAMKLSTMRYAMGSLFPSEQTDLLEKFANQILEGIPKLSNTAEQNYLSAYANSLAPTTCTANSVARLLKATNGFISLDPSVVKAYKISKQNDERCVKISNLMH